MPPGLNAETHIYRPIWRCPNASLHSSPVTVSERCPEGPEMLHSEGGNANAHLSVFLTMEESRAANPKPALDCYIRNKQKLYPLSHWITKMGLLLHLSVTSLTQMLHKVFPINVLAHAHLHLFELFLSVNAKHCSDNFICTTLNLPHFYTSPCVLTSPSPPKKEVHQSLRSYIILFWMPHNTQTKLLPFIIIYTMVSCIKKYHRE